MTTRQWIQRQLLSAAPPTAIQKDLPERTPPALVSALGNQGMLDLMGSESAPDTSIPKQIRQRMELNSGISLEGVRVHYNSTQPERFGARAYTLGKEIYIASGQESTLPHELGHIISCTQGDTPAATAMVNGEQVSEDPSLEARADDLASHLTAAPSNASGALQAAAGTGCVMKSDRRRRKKTEEELDPTYREGSDLHRASLRTTTRREVIRRAVETMTPAGEFIDQITGEPVPGPYDFGHAPGHENAAMIQQATAERLTQAEFNERANNPNLYFLQNAHLNRSHLGEAGRQTSSYRDEGRQLTAQHRSNSPYSGTEFPWPPPKQYFKRYGR